MNITIGKIVTLALGFVNKCRYTLIHRQKIKKDHFGVNSVAKLQ